MANRHLQQVMRRIRALAGAHEGGETSDGPLLERFVAQGDEAAFADLLERHGPLVLGVCRRVLHDVHLAEDAFQATFLVLARKAGTLRKRDRIGTWLYSVARRVAGKARARVAQRQEQEKEMPDMGNFLSGESGVPARLLATPDSTAETDWRELRPLLDEAVDGLPAKYREPFVLCCLEGKTQAEAARQLGWPEGTVSGRLARAREQLRDRLSRRGLALSTGALTTLVAQNAIANTVPASLVCSTVKAANLFALGKAAAAAEISAHIVTLAEGALRAMFITKLKIAAVLLLTVAFAGGTTGVMFHQALAGKPGAGPATAQGADPAKPPAKDADPAKPALAQNEEPVKPKAEKQSADGKEPAKETVRPKEVRLITGMKKNQWLEPMTFSPDAKLFAGVVNPNPHAPGRLDGSGKLVRQPVCLWETFTGKELHKFELVKGDYFIGALAFSPDSNLVAAASIPEERLALGVGVSKNTLAIVIWQTATGKEIARIPGHGSNILCFSAEGKSLASADADGLIRLWDSASGKEVRRFEAPQGEKVKSMAFSPDGKLLAGTFNYIAPSSGAPNFVAGQNSYSLLQWEMDSGKEVFRLRQDNRWIKNQTFSPDSKILYLVELALVRFWDVAMRKEIREVKGDFGSVVLSPSGRIMISTANSWVEIWEVASGKKLRRFNPNSNVRTAIFLADDKTFLTVGDDGTIKSWDLSDLPPLEEKKK